MPAKSHGLSRDENGIKTVMYRAWSAMKQRCYNEKTTGYKDYGGRGIIVCERWLTSFENFYADMGEKPGPEYSLERKNNNGNYEPGNCKWATQKEQVANQRDRMRKLYKTDALLLELVPQLHAKGFPIRRIAALFNIGKTHIQNILDGRYDKVIMIGEEMYLVEKRKINHSVKRILRTRNGP